MPKPDFRGFLIFVIDGSGVSFGWVANLLKFIPHHMTALPVFMCLNFQASHNFERRKSSTCIFLWPWSLGLTLQIMVIVEVPCTSTSTIKPNLRKVEHWLNMGICVHFSHIISECGNDFRKSPFVSWGKKMKYWFKIN